MRRCFDAERAGSRTSRTRKHSLVDVYPGVMFHLISCQHTRVWWDWQTFILEVRILGADSQVLYWLHWSWRLSLRRGSITILQYNSRHYWQQECTHHNANIQGQKTTNTSICQHVPSLTIYSSMSWMHCISCIMSNSLLTALCTALPWTVFFSCLDTSPFPCNCHLILTLVLGSVRSNPSNRQERGEIASTPRFGSIISDQCCSLKLDKKSKECSVFCWEVILLDLSL